MNYFTEWGGHVRKVGDVMKDIGFNKDSSEDVQKAFIKNLIKQAYGVEVKETPSKKFADQNVPSRRAQSALEFPQQLSFDLSEAATLAKKPASA